jgi:hypothetical protein
VRIDLFVVCSYCLFLIVADNLKNLLENYDFFTWHEGQKVDESKRVGNEKNINNIFGVDGTFKKLEID